MCKSCVTVLAFVFSLILTFSVVAQAPESWKREFPKNNFSKSSVAFSEIFSGGPPRDGIPSIENPKFELASQLTIPDTEPVIGVFLNGLYKAYPLRMMTWHEIVNDEIGGTPITVTFCPLCNAAIVFDRRLEGRVLDFGTTGRLRNSDLIMYDRQTETFWQQALGEGIIGELTGKVLKIIPARLESWKNFKARADAKAEVLVPKWPYIRRYGENPYVSYDDASVPFLYDGSMPKGIKALQRVVTTPARKYAYSIARLRREKRVTANDGTVFTWTPGQNSALDSFVIAEGKDVGNVVATKVGKDVPYFVEFAFVFYAFSPEAPIHK